MDELFTADLLANALSLILVRQQEKIKSQRLTRGRDIIIKDGLSLFGSVLDPQTITDKMEAVLS